MRNMGNVNRFVIRNSEVGRPLGTFSHRLEDNIKVDIRGIECQGVD